VTARTTAWRRPASAGETGLAADRALACIAADGAKAGSFFRDPALISRNKGFGGDNGSGGSMTIPRCAAMLLAAVAASLSLISPASASGQAQCGPREEIVKALGETFKEAPIGMGVTQPGQVLELFASRAGTWTMVVTTPNGTSGLIAAGENWDMVRLPKGRLI
jgi:hypothetical protein